MGVWHFYIDLNVDAEVLDAMLSEYRCNNVYKRVFSFCKITDESSFEGYNAGIESVIDNFLPAIYMIFDFLSEYARSGIRLKTNEKIAVFDFDKKSDFLKFMFEAWEEKISSMYENFGVLAVDYKEYYKTRNRLYKKYYVKIPRKQRLFISK